MCVRCVVCRAVVVGGSIVPDMCVQQVEVGKIETVKRVAGNPRTIRGAGKMWAACRAVTVRKSGEVLTAFVVGRQQRVEQPPEPNGNREVGEC